MLRSVHSTPESCPAVCIPPRSHAPQCASHPGVMLRSVHPTPKSCSAVYIPPRSHAPQCASHPGIMLFSVHTTSESNYKPRSYNQKLCWSLVALLRRNYQMKSLLGEHIHHERKDLEYKSGGFRLRGAMHTTLESEFFNLL